MFSSSNSSSSSRCFSPDRKLETGSPSLLAGNGRFTQSGSGNSGWLSQEENLFLWGGAPCSLAKWGRGFGGYFLTLHCVNKESTRSSRHGLASDGVGALATKIARVSKAGRAPSFCSDPVCADGSADARRQLILREAASTTRNARRQLMLRGMRADSAHTPTLIPRTHPRTHTGSSYYGRPL